MVNKETEDNIAPIAEERVTVPPAVGSFLMSFAFWCLLLIATLMYAAVALSPKFAEWISIRQQHAANAVRLHEMEDEADYLERVAVALKNDPEFVHRLVHATQSGTAQHDFMSRSDGLTFGGTRPEWAPAEPLVSPAMAETIIHLGSHQSHRTWLLFCAAALTVFAFTILNESGAGIIESALSAVQRLSESAVARYRRVSPEPPVQIPENHGDDALSHRKRGVRNQ
jgi:hypothetical protein